MVTTFFGAESFGGDAAYVDRLSRALLRRGHEVHVIHCVDSFELLRGGQPRRPYTPPDGLQVHPIRSGLGPISPLWTQTTGGPGPKLGAIQSVLDAVGPDVVHFHNISLIGGPRVLQLGAGATRIMTAHEYWLICPMHLLWKFDDRSCDQPECLRCMLQGKRPPQLWRQTKMIEEGLRHLDVLTFPSRYALERHRDRGITGPMPMVSLPLFLPDDPTASQERRDPPTRNRPYLAAAGRLVKMKGFQRLIPLMKWLPEADLRIAGTGPYEPTLRRLAKDLPNVHFEGLLGGGEVSGLFQEARAVVVPSLFPETFGYVTLEAFAVKTPAIVHRGGGALQETGIESGGGIGYDTDDELLLAMRRLVHDDGLREQLAQRGFQARSTLYSEATHLDRYLGLVRLFGPKSAIHGPHPAHSGNRPNGTAVSAGSLGHDA